MLFFLSFYFQAPPSPSQCYLSLFSQQILYTNIERAGRQNVSQLTNVSDAVACWDSLVAQLFYVVVQFYTWFNFYFSLFFFMLICDNEYETKENKNWTKDKIELQRIFQSMQQVRPGGHGFAFCGNTFFSLPLTCLMLNIPSFFHGKS